MKLGPTREVYDEWLLTLAQHKTKHLFELISVRLEETVENSTLDGFIHFAQITWEQPNYVKEVFAHANISLDVVLRAPKS